MSSAASPTINARPESGRSSCLNLRLIGLLLLLAWPAGIAARDIVFCSYNLRNWLTQPGRGESAAIQKPEKEKSRVVELLAIAKPEILGLSEIGDDKDLSELQQRLASAEVNLPHRHSVSGADPLRRIALLSKWPLKIHPPARELTYTLAGKTLAMQRGILDVEIQSDSLLPLRLLGVHLKSMREVADADQALMRRHEARLLRQHIDSILKDAPQTQLLCYGDLNDHLNSTTLRTITGTRNRSNHLSLLRPTDGRGETWTHHWAAADVYSRLDYVMVSQSLRPLIQGSRLMDQAQWQEASDHRAVLIEIRMAP